jgi:pimeloyl-ACP methyl ester carboxylesterase
MRAPHALHFVERGRPSAPAVVFLHGITGSRRYWEKRVGSLADRYRLVLPDLLGFGLSPKPYLDYTMVVYRDSLRAFIEEVGLAERPVMFVAHSLGSLIALEYAALHPYHVRRMVLMSLPRFQDPATAHALFWRGSPHYRRLLNQQSFRHTLAQMRRSGLELTIRYMFRFPWAVIADSHKFTFKSLTSTLECCLLNYQVDRILPSVPTVPTLLIHGEQDSVAPLAHISELPDRYPYMRLVTVDGTGHHVFLTHTRLCLEHVSLFLEEA